MSTVARWLATVVRALRPRRDPVPTRVVLLWVAALLLPFITAFVLAPTQCFETTTVPCRWPRTQTWVPVGVGVLLVGTAALATRSALRQQRGKLVRADWTALGWVAPVVVVLALLLLVRSYG